MLSVYDYDNKKTWTLYIIHLDPSGTVGADEPGDEGQYQREGEGVFEGV